jgi:hypothetical protein
VSLRQPGAGEKTICAMSRCRKDTEYLRFFVKFYFSVSVVGLAKE